MKQRKNNSGFSLIEILLSMAIIGLIAGLSLPLYQSFNVRNEVDIAENTAVQTIRRAQVLSRAVDGDSRWGVYIESGKITLFRGDSFSDRDQSLDTVFSIQNSITVSGQQEYVFKKLSGEPTQTGSTSLITTTNATRTISVNEEGTVSF